MSNDLIKEYKTVIKQYEDALKECNDSDDYYKRHIELFKKKIKELGGDV